MTQAQRVAIASPATGLLVYQTDNPAGFYFYNGSWTSLSGTATQALDMGNQNITNVNAITATRVNMGELIFSNFPTTTFTPTNNVITGATLDATGKTFIKIQNTNVSNYAVYGIAGGVHGKVIYLWSTHSVLTMNFNSTNEPNQSYRLSSTIASPSTSATTGHFLIKIGRAHV